MEESKNDDILPNREPVIGVSIPDKKDGILDKFLSFWSKEIEINKKKVTWDISGCSFFVGPV